jgi:hypothetical protein
MRFISRYGRFGVQVRPLLQEAYANGMVRVIQEAVAAYFEPWKLTPLEREMAVQHWTFNGSLQEADEVTTVPPDYRIGLFDSLQAQEDHGWSDEVREEVERKLLEHAGKYDDVLVVSSMIPPPWPRYDDFRGTPGQLVRRLVEDGHDLDAVLTYEREHQNRPKVVSEIEKAISTGTVELELEEEEQVIG